MLWTLALALGLSLVAGLYVYSRFDDQLRRLVVARLGHHYQGLVVEVGRARWITGQGIELRDLAILEPDADGPQPELTRVDEVFLTTGAQVTDLVHGLPDFHEVVIRRAVLRMTRRSDDRWSVSRLLPIPSLSQGYPRIVIENATVEVFDPLRNPSSTLTLRDVNLVLTPPQATAGSDPATPPTYEVRGHLFSEHARDIEVVGRLSLDGSTLDLGGSVVGLNWCPELQAALGQLMPLSPGPAAGLRAEAQVTYRVGYQSGRAPPWAFQIDAQLEGGRWEDPSLPYPLSDLKAQVHFSPQGVRIDHCTARNGPSQIWLSGERNGYGPESELSVKLMGRRLILDERWSRVEGLPREWRDQWAKFLPSGEMDLDLEAQYGPQGWRPNRLISRLRNLAFSYYQFPYRLERAEGSIELRDEQLRLSLKAHSQGEEVRLVGSWDQPTQGGPARLKVTADRLPLDQKLFDALPEEVRGVITALHPRGSFRFDAQVQHGAGTWDAPSRYELTIGLDRCQVQYDRFAYPLSDVRGTIRVADGLWTFDRISGTNDTGHVECNGRLEPTSEGWLLVLALAGQNVPIDEELRDSLSDPRLREMWNQVQPRGAVNFRSQVSWLSARPDVHLWARVWPIAEKTSIEPVWFPYRLENLGGEFFFQDRHVDFEGLTASHGPTRLVAASGDCDLRTDGSWQVDIERLVIERLEADRDLAQALSPATREMVRQLDPRGWVNLEGQVRLERGPGTADPVTSSWRLQADLQDGQLTMSVPVNNLHGGVQLSGRYDGTQIDCLGELAIDSAMVRNAQLVNLRGPVRLADSRLLLGAAAVPASNGVPARHLTAEVCGGMAYGDGLVVLSDPMEYRLDAALASADLARCARELAGSQTPLAGKLSGQIHLTGRGSEAYTRSGYGNLQLREANIYDSPLMVRLLSVASVRQPDRSAFTDSDVDFRVAGEHVYFDQIQFKGDVVSLRGRGEMNASTDLNLDFFAMVGREPLNLPIVGGVLRGASQQFMQIHVRGKLSDPQVTKETLPGVKKGLQSLGIELRPPDRPLPRLLPEVPAPTSPPPASPPQRTGQAQQPWRR